MNSNYIKVMLTVITVCLVLIVIELASLVPVNAQQDEGVMDINVKAIGGKEIKENSYTSFGDYPPIRVRVIE